MLAKDTRVLILGGGGTLGHKLWQHFSARLPNAWVTVRKDRAAYARCGLFSGPNVVDGLDLRDFHRLGTVLDELKPQLIINCAGVTLRSREAQDKNSAISVNALLPHRLADWCARSGARLFHFSTVCVYDGKKGAYNEDDMPDARDLYGVTKALGDVNAPFALTLRSSFIGREISAGTELLEWFLAQGGRTVKGYTRAMFTGLTTNRLAALAWELADRHPALNGLYHVSSETVSKYDLLVMMRDAYKLDVKIEPEDGFEMRRDLDGRRFAAAAGFACPPWREMMAEMAADPTPYAGWRK